MSPSVCPVICAHLRVHYMRKRPQDYALALAELMGRQVRPRDVLRMAAWESEAIADRCAKCRRLAQGACISRDPLATREAR